MRMLCLACNSFGSRAEVKVAEKSQSTACANINVLTNQSLTLLNNLRIEIQKVSLYVFILTCAKEGKAQMKMFTD